VKTIDPVRGPLIKTAFELYASRRYSLLALETELHTRGLCNKSGGIVDHRHLSIILRNLFYIGLMRIYRKKETYPGIHTPLITSGLFNEVQLVLTGKRSDLRQRNNFLLRGFIVWFKTTRPSNRPWTRHGMRPILHRQAMIEVPFHRMDVGLREVTDGISVGEPE
jgi:hypothetical protein